MVQSLMCSTRYKALHRLQMHILSIDIGPRNFAWSLHDTETGEYTFKVQDLGKVKDYVKKMRELSSQEPFLSADVILVENQMRACMKTMATSLRCFHYDKTIPVAPQSIKRFFKTCICLLYTSPSPRDRG